VATGDDTDGPATRNSTISVDADIATSPFHDRSPQRTVILIKTDQMQIGPNAETVTRGFGEADLREQFQSLLVG
jgi:hypothetical protein